MEGGWHAWARLVVGMACMDQAVSVGWRARARLVVGMACMHQAGSGGWHVVRMNENQVLVTVNLRCSIVPNRCQSYKKTQPRNWVRPGKQ